MVVVLQVWLCYCDGHSLSSLQRKEGGGGKGNDI